MLSVLARLLGSSRPTRARPLLGSLILLAATIAVAAPVATAAQDPPSSAVPSGAPSTVPPAAHAHHHPARHGVHARHRPPRHPPPHHPPPRHPPPAAVVVPPPAVAPPPAPPPVPANKGRMTGLPLPRFASLRASEVNMRAGPGDRYPILWLYRRRDLPVKIEREFDVWRLVEDADGVRGWMHQATLTGARSFLVTATGVVSIGDGEADRGHGTVLRDDPRPEAGVVAVLRPGVVGRLRDCPAASDWCRVTTNGYGGWLRRSAIFGLLPGEAITPP